MSNVLIGIIGVILFIGLALAGALFLGPRFQQSTQNSKAAAAVQAMTQIVHASNLYRLNEGASPPETVESLLGGYLKSVPKNPMGGDDPYVVHASPDISGSNDFVVMDLGESDEAVCRAINRQTVGKEDIVTVRTDSASPPTIRCYGVGDAFLVRAKI